MACLLLGRLLEIDRESAKEMFRGMLLKPVSRDLGPPGVFHIQAAGTLMGTMARNPQSHRSDVPWVERLMEEVWTADPEIYGGKQLRNALVASLLGLDYAISGSSLDDALGLRTLTQRCLDRVGDDRLRLYFLQTLAEDLTLLLPDLEDGSNVAKFLMLAGILRPEALRWSDPAILNRLDRVRAEITAPPV